MKKILLIGKNSYIARNILEWLTCHDMSSRVETLSVRDSAWMDQNWSEYSSIVHCAALVHQEDNSFGRMKDFLEVNYVLTKRIAEKAKKEGVRHFLYISTNDVFASSNKYNTMLRITKDTVLNPQTPYAISKYMAEEALLSLEEADFMVSIIRPPLVYGKECSGNYQRLSKYAKYMKFFPKISAQRSMIYIDNLCELIRLILQEEKRGIFMPQNREYVNVSNLLVQIAECRGEKIHLIPGFQWIQAALSKHSNTLAKIFGTFVMEKDDFQYFNWNYCVVPFEKSIAETEK